MYFYHTVHCFLCSVWMCHTELNRCALCSQSPPCRIMWMRAPTDMQSSADDWLLRGLNLAAQCKVLVLDQVFVYRMSSQPVNIILSFYLLFINDYWKKHFLIFRNLETLVFMCLFGTHTHTQKRSASKWRKLSDTSILCRFPFAELSQLIWKDQDKKEVRNIWEYLKIPKGNYSTSVISNPSQE